VNYLNKAPTALVIPLFNESESINKWLSPLISDNKELSFILIDDGSVDGTQEDLGELSKRNNNVYIIRNKENQGKIFSQSVGLKLAYEKSMNALLMDGDGQHSSKDMQKILNEGRGNNKLTIGIRGESYSRSLLARVGTYFLNLTLRLLGIEFDDRESEFIFLPTGSLSQIIESHHLGLLPINSIINQMNFEKVLVDIEIMPRAITQGNSDTRHNSSALLKKAMSYIFSEPWKLISKITKYSLLLAILSFTYGLYIGANSILQGKFSGISSLIMVVLFFSVVIVFILIIILGFIALEFERINRSEKRKI